MKNKSYIGISFIVLIFGIWVVPKIVAKFQKSDLVEIGPVPAFKLTNQDNKTISDKDYLGKVYVVEFFFSTCPTICPKMNESMLQLQNEFYGNPNFGIASITIDPAKDTPQVLKEHADLLGVKHYNWHFLTGDKELNHRGRKGKNKKGEEEYKESYNTISAADLHNEMTDDVKIILREYRLALKKNKNERKDAFRDNIKENIEKQK